VHTNSMHCEASGADPSVNRQHHANSQAMPDRIPKSCVMYQDQDLTLGA
jgi:hypothetical protein